MMNEERERAVGYHAKVLWRKAKWKKVQVAKRVEGACERDE
jgi:hypothetical protein